MIRSEFYTGLLHGVMFTDLLRADTNFPELGEYNETYDVPLWEMLDFDVFEVEEGLEIRWTSAWIFKNGDYLTNEYDAYFLEIPKHYKLSDKSEALLGFLCDFSKWSISEIYK